MIPENGSSSVPASTPSIPVDQKLMQQDAKISVGKEVTINGDDGNNDTNSKKSSSHEDLDLQEWYKTFFLVDNSQGILE